MAPAALGPDGAAADAHEPAGRPLPHAARPPPATAGGLPRTASSDRIPPGSTQATHHSQPSPRSPCNVAMPDDDPQPPQPARPPRRGAPGGRPARDHQRPAAGGGEPAPLAAPLGPVGRVRPGAPAAPRGADRGTVDPGPPPVAPAARAPGRHGVAVRLLPDAGGRPRLAAPPAGAARAARRCRGPGRPAAAGAPSHGGAASAGAAGDARAATTGGARVLGEVGGQRLPSCGTPPGVHGWVPVQREGLSTVARGTRPGFEITS